MSVNSHIQLPKGVLKYFTNESKDVLYLDIETNKILTSHSGDLGVEFGYYSENMEKYLEQKIENQFTEMAARVRKFSKKGGTLLLSPNDELAFKNYIRAAMARSELAMHTFLFDSYFSPAFTNQENHDRFVYSATQPNSGIGAEIDDFHMVILINKTDVNFVVPRNCYYLISSLGQELLVAPISPKCALCLCPNEYSDIVPESKINRLSYIDKTDDILFMNTKALNHEYLFNNKFVASATKPELEILRDYLDNYRKNWEEQRAKLFSHEEA